MGDLMNMKSLRDILRDSTVRFDTERKQSWDEDGITCHSETGIVGTVMGTDHNTGLAILKLFLDGEEIESHATGNEIRQLMEREQDGKQLRIAGAWEDAATGDIYVGHPGRLARKALELAGITGQIEADFSDRKTMHARVSGLPGGKAAMFSIRRDGRTFHVEARCSSFVDEKETRGNVSTIDFMILFLNRMLGQAGN